ncbi:MAG: 2Fe-2S iron-sulfur cluster binding domain-containing protein [Gammaproteobacteria bacterium]|nr:2Fe-2S iron-sulfur cluster binding domain-containing protein [Gammaproteobacteria bacterium]
MVSIIALAVLFLCGAYLIFLAGRAAWDAVRVRRLDAAEQAWFEAKLASLANPLREVSSPSADSWVGYRKFELRAKVLEADDICSLYFVPHDGRPLPMYAPGQYLTFQLAPEDGQAQEVRCYSLSDSPTNPDYYRVSVKRLPDADGEARVSTYLHRQVNVGDLIDVKAPTGAFTLDQEYNGPLVFIAGGIGITPFLSMINFLVATDSQREVWLFYGATHGGRHMLRDYLNDVCAQHENVHSHVWYSSPREEDKPGEDYDQAGRVNMDEIKATLSTNNFRFYICGPGPMMDYVASGLREWGVPDAHIRLEAFGAESVKQITRGRSAANTESFKVRFARSERALTWKPSSGSLLDFAETSDVPMYSGCRAGNCGSCTTAVRQGTVEYLKPPGIEIPPGSCLTCIAIPKSDIVLDA